MLWKPVLYIAFIQTDISEVVLDFCLWMPVFSALLVFKRL
jgi:hypothetical protein